LLRSFAPAAGIDIVCLKPRFDVKASRNIAAASSHSFTPESLLAVLVPEMNQGVVHGLLGNLDHPVEWRVQFQD
jgi:hypothetical protein